MDPISQQQALAAAGAGGEGEYVDNVFSTDIYVGNGGNQTITNGIDLSGEGGMVWLKRRDSSTYGGIWDTERGKAKRLRPDNADSESHVNYLMEAFNNNGYTVGASGGSQINNNGSEYVAWTFRKCPGFFDVVTYTGNNTNGTQIAHNLGTAPGMILVKSRGTSQKWAVYHRSLGATKYMVLNETSDQTDMIWTWYDTEPTSTHFTVGDDNWVNSNGIDYVAYLFAHDDQSFGEGADESIIKCGSYTGNGSSSNGPTVDLGFEPQWLLIKDASTSGPDWYLFDANLGWTRRGETVYLRPNLTNGESISNYNYPQLRLTSTGFKLMVAGGDINRNNSTFIYCAIGRSNKPVESGSDVFATQFRYGQSSTRIYDFGLDRPLDFVYTKKFGGTSTSPVISTRLMGQMSFRANSTGSGVYSDHTSSSNKIWAYTDGKVKYVYEDNLNHGSYEYVHHGFSRARKFFDVVCYDALGAGSSQPHNLGVKPALKIIKSINSSPGFIVWAAPFGDRSDYLLLNNSDAVSENDTYWDAADTDTHFSVRGGNSGSDNYGDSYVAYLFADTPGVTKIGTYSGSSSDVNVDCGFTNGARFVLIKRTDTTGDWWLFWAAGILTGNDKYVRWNLSTPGNSGNYDYIDPLSSGFTVTGAAPSDMNASGGTYLFFAIA